MTKHNLKILRWSQQHHFLKDVSIFFNTMHERVNKTKNGIYLLKFNNRNTRTRCEKCSKLINFAIGVFLVSSLLTLNIFHSLF